MMFRQHVMAATTLAAVAAAVALAVVSTALPLSDEGRHALGHLAPGFPALLLALVAARLWPRPGGAASARTARVILVAGLVIFGIGQAVEAVGAFGYRGDERVNFMARLHDAGVVLAPAGLLALLAGALSTVLPMLASRLGPHTQRSIVLAVAGAVALAVLYGASALLFGL